MGHPGFLGHRQQTQPEGLLTHRGLAQSSYRGRISLYLSRRIVLKCRWAGKIKNVSMLIAVGVAECHKEDKVGWSSFLFHLKQQGLKSIKLVISDTCPGLVESGAGCYPAANWQRCPVHFYRNVFSYVPKTRVKQVAKHAQGYPCPGEPGGGP